MRRSQWFVFTIVFLLSAIAFQYIGNNASSMSEEMASKNLEDVKKAAEEKTLNEAFMAAQLVTQSGISTLFIASNTTLNFSNLCWAVFLACLICGLIEFRAEKKKK